MAASILIVEDDVALTALLSYNLIAAGFEVIAVNSGEQALSAVTQHQPNLVILDWMLPGMSGMDICRNLRSQLETKDLPVVLLTARALPDDKLLAFEAGVDDYIAKPFSVSELIARIHALLRRAYRDGTNFITTVGELQIDALAHQVRFRGVEMLVTPVGFRLLEYFIERRGRVLSRSQLIERVWYDSADVNERIVDIHVGHLRRSLASAGASDYIKTVRGAGYMLSIEDE